LAEREILPYAVKEQKNTKNELKDKREVKLEKERKL